MVAGLFDRHAGMSDHVLQRPKQIRRRRVEFASNVKLQADSRQFPESALVSAAVSSLLFGPLARGKAG